MGRNKEEDKKHALTIFEKESVIKMVAGTNDLEKAKRAAKKVIKRMFENAYHSAKLK
jgi:hypothetical protein